MNNIQFGGKTDKGLKRNDNQDTFLACNISFIGGDAVLLAAIDGVGGFAGGEIAAGITAEELKKYLDGYRLPYPDVGIEQAMISANNQIVRYASESIDYCQMGCVASACIIDQYHILHYAHVGDTRLYLYHNGELKKLTHDHSNVGAMEEAGDLTEEEAMFHPDRNKIYRMVGSELHRQGDSFVESGSLQLSNECQILLCSDGLTDQVFSSVIKSVLSEEISPQDKVEELIQLANAKGGKDNVTVVIAEVKS